jgi:hypothetical protein
MASELRVNTLKDAAGNNSVAMTYVANGSAKAWVNFNGTGTIAIRDSFSTSSITDTATGNTTVTISSAMNNANDYATVGNSGNGGTNPGNGFTSSNGITSTTGHHETMDDDAINADRAHNSLIFHGDLA